MEDERRADSLELDGRPLVIGVDHHCFGCGRLNPRGLRLSFWELPVAQGPGVGATFTPHPEFEGYIGVVHGGIVSTVLDEIMAWALYARGIWAVTAELSVRFRRPIPVDRATRAIGQLVVDRGRLLETSGEIRAVEDDALLATATGRFMRVPPAQAAAWAERYLPPGRPEPGPLTD